MTRRPLPLLLACAVLALVLTAVVAGCGSSAGSEAGGLTASAPRDAAVYMEATLRPKGAQREDALAAAGKLLGTGDPAGRIRQLLQQAFGKSDPPVDFAKDIEPWLGERAALWVGTPPPANAASGANPTPPVGAIVQVRDGDLARTKLEAIASRSSGTPLKRSVAGHDYELFGGDDDPTAVAFRAGEVLLGTEPGVRRMLTLPEDGGLDRADAYRKAIAGLDDDRLGTFYLDTNRLLDFASSSDPQAGQQLARVRRLLGPDALRPTAVSFTADGTRMAIESLAPAGGGVAAKFGGLAGGSGSALFRELPGASWAALALPKAGRTLQAVFDQRAGALGGAIAAEQFRRETGLDLQRDVLSWIGDLGVFARGTSARTIDGGLVIEVTDTARAAAAFGKFVGLARVRGGLDPKPVRVRGADAAFAVSLPHAPKPVVLARNAHKMVLAFGQDAAAQALDPDQPLEQGESYAKAVEALGDGFDPSLMVSFPAIVSLVEATGNADAGWERAKPYLDNLGVLATGAKRDGDELRSRLVLGFK